MELDGAWDTTGLIRGFDLDTVAETIAAPPPKVEGARTYLLRNEFLVGSQHVTLNALQTLRGYMQHWPVASMFWESCVQPADLLLTYGSASCLTVNCANFQIWSGYWGMMSLLQTLSKDEEAWSSLYKNTLVRTIAPHRRFSGPRIIEDVRWITTDATPRIIGVVNLRARNYIRVDAEETMNDYVEADGLQAGISNKELTGLVLGSVAGYAAHPGAVLFVGVGNLNDVACVVRGKSRGKAPRKLMITFLLWCVSTWVSRWQYSTSGRTTTSLMMK